MILWLIQTTNLVDQRNLARVAAHNTVCAKNSEQIMLKLSYYRIQLGCLIFQIFNPLTGSQIEIFCVRNFYFTTHIASSALINTALPSSQIKESDSKNILGSFQVLSFK